jgi:hypothetical protein
LSLSVDTTSKAARRQIADEFKERKVPRGIYAIRCSITGDAWVGSSNNLNAVKNSQWFQLRNGVHRNLSLQATWKHHTEEAFLLEILEQFDEDISPLLLNDLLTTKKKEWAGTLRAKVL